MKKILIAILLLSVAGFSIFSIKKLSKKCVKVDFSTILEKQYYYLENGKETDITITFSNDGRIFGFGGVNEYFAGYKLEDNNQIVFSPIGSTMMAGPIEKMDLEKKYFDLLKESQKIETYKGKIILTTKNNEILKFLENNNPITVNDKEVESGSMGPELENNQEPEESINIIETVPVTE